jgi:PmbA protein
MGASVVMQDGGSTKQSWDMEWATAVHGLDPGRTAYDITQRTGRLLGARPLPTGRYIAYFEPKAFINLLATFWPLWSGKAVMEGKSRLAGRMGEVIGASLVTLVDDPTLPGGLATRPFDAEGAAARPVTLVDAGVLRGFLTNSESARALAMENTGHAARGYRGFLSVAPSNLHVKPGAGVRMDHGVLVAEVMGLHAGANPVTAQFSVQGLGLKVEGGEIAYPVENFAVAGDFLTLLRQVTALGETLRWDLGGGSAFGSPLVEVQDLSFAGA